ncbi:MAG: glycosyltransferase [Sedimentisphaerales bacterium]|jgi:glycosyltransferase involved in cell wall biosynthesis
MNKLSNSICEIKEMAVPKVSVCMPCYNRQDYIAEAIESVLSQSFRDFELVITDNCSTDGTIEIIKKYASKDSRIRFYINSTNLGMISNFNRSVLLGSGEYIKVICSDDLLAPGCLAVFADVLDKNPSVSLVTSFSKEFGENDLVRDEKFFPGTGLLDGKKSQKSLFLDGNWAGSPTYTMFRRRDLYVGLFNHWKYWVCDHDMWLRLMGVGDMYVVPEILSFIRVHNNRATAIHGVDFRLIIERLMLAEIAFYFPHMYGEYTKKEKRNIRYHLLKRLVREGYGRSGLKPKINMLKIGLSDLNKRKLIFLLLLIKNFHRIFKRSRWSD